MFSKKAVTHTGMQQEAEHTGCDSYREKRKRGRTKTQNPKQQTHMQMQTDNNQTSSFSLKHEVKNTTQCEAV